MVKLLLASNHNYTVTIIIISIILIFLFSFCCCSCSEYASISFELSCFLFSWFALTASAFKGLHSSFQVITFCFIITELRFKLDIKTGSQAPTDGYKPSYLNNKHICWDYKFRLQLGQLKLKAWDPRCSNFRLTNTGLSKNKSTFQITSTIDAKFLYWPHRCYWTMTA